MKIKSNQPHSQTFADIPRGLEQSWHWVPIKSEFTGVFPHSIFSLVGMRNSPTCQLPETPTVFELIQGEGEMNTKWRLDERAEIILTSQDRAYKIFMVK